MSIRSLRPLVRRPLMLVLQLVTAAAAVLLLLPSAAQAQSSSAPLVPGLTITGATITGSGPENGRTLDAATADQFLQAWFGATMVGTPTFSDPPPGADTYQVLTTLTFNGEKGFFTTNVALSGDTMWISLPVQMLWPGVGVGPEQANKWFVAPPMAQEAFGASSSPSTTVAPDGGSSSGSSIGLIVVIVVLLIGAAVAVLRRRGRRATTSS